MFNEQKKSNEFRNCMNTINNCVEHLYNSCKNYEKQIRVKNEIINNQEEIIKSLLSIYKFLVEEVDKKNEGEKLKERCRGGVTRIRNNKMDGYICRTCGLYEEYHSFWQGDKKILKHFGINP